MLTIKINDHAFFKRVDKNIETEVSVTLSEALLGARITIMTIEGPLTIVTKPGLSTGDTMTIEHYGVEEFNPPDGYDPQTSRGHHIIKFKVLLPDFDPNGNSE